MQDSTDYRLRHLQEVIGNQYRFQGELGQGGAATVYKVTNLRLGRLEALKVLSQDHLNVPEFSRRFTREAKLAAALDHPNIVKVYDFGMEEGLFWYTMQYIDGPTLNHVLQTKGALSTLAVTRLAIPLLDALQYIHEHGVVHRDVKPGNIILDTACRPFLMDFGIAKSLDSLKKTQTVLMLGTPAYLSPEQVSGASIDGRSDIYSIGVTFYELLAGKLPFSGDSAFESIMSRMNRDPEPLSGVRPDLDPRLEEIVMQSLERDREKRFPTAAEMRNSFLSLPGADRESLDSAGGTASFADKWLKLELGLDDWAAPGPANDSQATTRPAVQKRRKRARLIGVGLMGLVLLALGAYFIRRSSSTPREPAGELASGRIELTATQPGPLASGLPKAGPTHPPDSSKGDRKLAGTPAIITEDTRTRPSGMAAGTVRTESEPLTRRPAQPPQLLERPPVQLSEGVAETCRGQMVGVSVTIGEDGQVKRSRLLSSVPPECGKAALEAVRQYVYRPALDAAGKPVEATIGIAVQLF